MSQTEFPAKVQCFPLERDCLTIDALCGKLGLKFELGGPPEATHRVTGFDEWENGSKRHESFKWVTAYIHCRSPRQASIILTQLREEVQKLGEVYEAN